MNNTSVNQTVTTTTTQQLVSTSVMKNISKTFGTDNIDEIKGRLDNMKEKGEYPADDKVYIFVLGKAEPRLGVKREIHCLGHGKPCITIENSGIASVVPVPVSTQSALSVVPVEHAGETQTVTTQTIPSINIAAVPTNANTTNATNGINPNWEPEIRERYKNLVESLKGLNLFLNAPMLFNDAVCKYEKGDINHTILEDYVVRITKWYIKTNQDDPRICAVVTPVCGMTMHVDHNKTMGGLDRMLRQDAPNTTSRVHQTLLTNISYVNMRNVLKKMVTIIDDDIMYGHKIFKYTSAMEPCEDLLSGIKTWKQGLSRVSRSQKRKKHNPYPIVTVDDDIDE